MGNPIKNISLQNTNYEINDARITNEMVSKINNIHDPATGSATAQAGYALSSIKISNDQQLSKVTEIAVPTAIDINGEYVGDANTPVFINGYGKPQAFVHTIESSVPADAQLTDTFITSITKDSETPGRVVTNITLSADYKSLSLETTSVLTSLQYTVRELTANQSQYTLANDTNHTYESCLITSVTAVQINAPSNPIKGYEHYILFTNTGSNNCIITPMSSISVHSTYTCKSGRSIELCFIYDGSNYIVTVSEDLPTDDYGNTPYFVSALTDNQSSYTLRNDAKHTYESVTMTSQTSVTLSTQSSSQPGYIHYLYISNSGSGNCVITLPVSSGSTGTVYCSDSTVTLASGEKVEISWVSPISGTYIITVSNKLS